MRKIDSTLRPVAHERFGAARSWIRKLRITHSSPGLRHGGGDLVGHGAQLDPRRRRIGVRRQRRATRSQGETEKSFIESMRTLPAGFIAPCPRPSAIADHNVSLLSSCHFCLAATSIFLKADTQDPLEATLVAATGRAA